MAAVALQSVLMGPSAGLLEAVASSGVFSEWVAALGTSSTGHCTLH